VVNFLDSLVYFFLYRSSIIAAVLLFLDYTPPLTFILL